jgi:cytochrome c biogenesis protein CcdA
MQIDFSAIGLALGAGVVAFFNPCGFALLPSYIAYYLGSRQSAFEERWWERGRQGLVLGTIVSAGFFTVLLALGGVISVVGTTIGAYFPWAVIFMGIGLIALAIFILWGHELSLPWTTWTARTTRPNNANALFYYFYGIGYALASCGCTLPIFMIYVVNPTVTTDVLSGFLNFFAYASGMTMMTLLLSLSMAYSKGGLDRRLPLYLALLGVSVPLGVLLFIVWVQPEVASSWLASLSGTNRIFVSIFAPALLLMLFFQMRRWERATHVLNALLLMAAGSYLIYYQLFEYGLLDLVFR